MIAIPIGRAWVLCGLLFAATALSFLDRQVLSVLAPQITAEFQMTNAVYSRVVFAFVLSYTVMFALGGRFLDAVGTRLGLAISVLLWSAASGMHAFATGAVSVEFNIKEGPITMFSIGVTAQGRSKFVLAEGQSVHGPIPATGNTNTRGFFRPDVRTFLKRWVSEGPTHHFALGTGHHAEALRNIADALHIESVIVGQERQ